MDKASQDKRQRSVDNLAVPLSRTERTVLIIAAAMFLIGSIGLYILRTADSGHIIEVFITPSAYLDPEVINNATIDELMEVSGIGEVKATQIHGFVHSLGGVKDVRSILSLDGISDATFNNLIKHFYGESYSYEDGIIYDSSTKEG